MILAEKITELRKKAGWSQEELADRLGVSRQSVSKWESAQSVPDMNRILRLSEVFHVSTDYLLKDDIEEPEASAEEEKEPAVDRGGKPLVPVSMEEANAYLKYRETSSGRIASGVALCITSPILIILLPSLGAVKSVPFSEGLGSVIGVSVLLLMIAAAVAIFVRCGLDGEKFEYLTKQDLDTEYGVEGMVREKKEKYHPVYVRNLTTGIALCAASAVPAVLSAAITDKAAEESAGAAVIDSVGVCVLLILIAAGVFLIVKSCIVSGSYQVLLEEGDYQRDAKHRDNHFGGIYWAIVTAGYLAVSFVTMKWGQTWIVWPIAGILYGAIYEIWKNLRGIPRS